MPPDERIHCHFPVSVIACVLSTLVGSFLQDKTNKERISKK
jgi:hypothetical protein